MENSIHWRLIISLLFPFSPVALPFDPGLADQELIRQQARERAQQEQLQPAAPDVRLSPPAVALPDYPADETPCFTLQKIVLEGELAQQFQWALHAVDNAESRCLGKQGINLLMQRVQNAVINRGYVTTRVFTKPQDFKHGTLELTVVPGRIRSIRFTEPVSLRAHLFNAMPAKPGDVLNLRDIEQCDTMSHSKLS